MLSGQKLCHTSCLFLDKRAGEIKEVGLHFLDAPFVDCLNLVYFFLNQVYQVPLTLYVAHKYWSSHISLRIMLELRIKYRDPRTTRRNLVELAVSTYYASQYLLSYEITVRLISLRWVALMLSFSHVLSVAALICVRAALLNHNCLKLARRVQLVIYVARYRWMILKMPLACAELLFAWASFSRLHKCLHIIVCFILDCRSYETFNLRLGSFHLGPASWLYRFDFCKFRSDIRYISEVWDVHGSRYTPH